MQEYCWIKSWREKKKLQHPCVSWPVGLGLYCQPLPSPANDIRRSSWPRITLLLINVSLLVVQTADTNLKDGSNKFALSIIVSMGKATALVM